ncbi:MAG: integrase arm-type DNA-binding domain-containing protein, partial [Pseudomonadota bacterium]
MGKKAGRNLTPKFIDGLKPGAKMTTFPDTTGGLELYVTAGGAKTFSLRYTLPDRTRRRLNLGNWPATTIEAARRAARAHLNTLAEGRDPATEVKRQRDALRTKPVKTLNDLIAALLTTSKVTGVRDSTLAYWTWLDKKHIAPRLGDDRLEDITPGVVRKTLREIGAAAGATTGNRAFGLLRRAFNFGLDEEHVATSPLARMKELFEEETRARVLSDEELTVLWAVSESTKSPARKGTKDRDDLNVSRAMAIAVQLCLVTGQRSGEVAGMRAAELDLKGATWILPQQRTKANREHVLPLTDLAIEL